MSATATTRIGMDGTPLLGQRSGVGYYTGNLLAALAHETPEWQYLLYSNRPLRPLEPDLNGAVEIDSYFPQSRWLWMQMVLPRAIRRNPPQLFHFPNALAPLWQPSPFVLTIHDASLFVYGQYHPWARHLTVRLLLPLVARRADAIITVSHHARAELVRVLGLPPEKIHVVYEAAASHFAPVTDPARLAAVRHKYRLPETFLLYVGTLEPRKNLLRLARAVACLREEGVDVPLIMAGPQGWMMSDFQREVARLGMLDRIRYLGYLPLPDLPVLYSLATVFVFPSLYEGFGLPPLEAMACGTPVLTSNRSSLAEVCGDAACLVDPEDVASISDGLRCLLGDAALRAELSRRGRQRVQRFSWEHAARKTAAVYRQVLEQH